METPISYVASLRLVIKWRLGYCPALWKVATPTGRNGWILFFSRTEKVIVTSRINVISAVNEVSAQYIVTENNIVRLYDREWRRECCVQ